MENARLYMTVSGRAEELRLLNEIATALTSTLDSAAIVRAALLHIQHLFKAGSVSLLQTDSHTGQLRMAYSLRGVDTLEIGQTFPCAEEIAARVLGRGEPLVLEDAQADPRWPREIDTWLGWPARALMCAPLAMPGRAFGVLEVIGDVPGIYNQATLRTLQAIASTLYVALQNARLYDELRQALRERETAQAQLIQAEKMAALGKLVASIAHEINNPLQAVQGCLSLAEEELHGQQRPQRMAEYLGIAGGEIGRIAAIMTRLRDFYRPGRAGFAPTDVHTLLQSVMALVAKPLRDAGVRVEYHVVEDLPIIHANADQLRQVFLNLILNAIEAMPQGGRLIVHTAPDQIRAAGSEEARPAVRIEFSDTGIGMPEEVRARLFEPLFTTKEHGAGLGLAISYNIVRAHDGEISVQSQLGVGSTFAILLPVSPSPGGALSDPYAPDAYGGLRAHTPAAPAPL
jgi:signal transduction histidine kinase